MLGVIIWFCVAIKQNKCFLKTEFLAAFSWELLVTCGDSMKLYFAPLFLSLSLSPLTVAPLLSFLLFSFLCPFLSIYLSLSPRFPFNHSLALYLFSTSLSFSISPIFFFRFGPFTFLSPLQVARTFWFWNCF